MHTKENEREIIGQNRSRDGKRTLTRLLFSSFVWFVSFVVPNVLWFCALA